ncbi:sensor histidine kinase [Shewanella gaetbuli]|uniref:histidine kinase n=1 Tax=Shewanella gaetbuli TaxID=220752 RepID=A0A9X1ZH02_9GAMM|nr:HAMP domain-containing sensor histidine kinase [Shewanella gaetbuli]MCL1142154.1 HAMP domain-containing histidine kinase [Shewanella gaetbuli]
MTRLFTRLFLVASAIVLMLFIALWQWLQLNHEFSRNQVQQSLHKELAEHMAHINPLLSQGVTSDAALKEAFHDFMLLGPSFEIYTLDPEGNVIAYDAKEEKIKKHRVDINNIEQFLNGQNLPILGTDPRSTDVKKIFSVSQLITANGLHSGYLYVIIGGEDYDSWQALINAENRPKIWGVTIGYWIIFALILLMLLLHYFTRPIQKLVNDLQHLKKQPLGHQLRLPKRYRGSLEINQLSEHINQLLVEIQQQQKQVKQQQQAKQDFLLHLSHDLKTPLTALLGYIDTWLILPKEQRDAALIQYAANSGQTLQQLLAQLLELAALENGQIEAQVKQVDLNELLAQVRQTFTPRAESLNVSLKLENPNNQVILTDPQLMRRVLNNLVDNALRYTPSGGTISIYTQLKQGQLWLTVEDTGAGMHQHEVEALTQLSLNQGESKPVYVKYDNDNSLPQLGVGLAIVRQLLTLLRCPININSTPGEGSQFMIEIAPQ